ncbi:MAG: hypothetical protein JNM39_16775 [Bdellovibrionaceae bacterium]|nr:hypothetical protein [Pseudobdellovibrionaceae bacterium]
MHTFNPEKLNRILTALDQCRALSLDCVEQELAESPRWKQVRSRLLKYWGSRGLESQIREIMLDGNPNEGVGRESEQLR